MNASQFIQIIIQDPCQSFKNLFLKVNTYTSFKALLYEISKINGKI